MKRFSNRKILGSLLASFILVGFLVFVGFHISLFFVAVVGLFADGMVFSGLATSVVC